MVEGQYRGMPLKFVDTPGLELSSTAVGYNNKVLNAIKGAQKKHKPDLVLYVDRCDVVRAASPSCIRKPNQSCCPVPDVLHTPCVGLRNCIVLCRAAAACYCKGCSLVKLRETASAKRQGSSLSAHAGVS